MNNKIDISIIIPTYNTEKYIVECLDSILQLDISAYEIIVVDDGSTDNTKKIIEDYQKKYDFISYYYQENAGQGAARNYAIDLAEGKYLYFMDSDDVMISNVFQGLFKKANSEDLDAIFFDGESFVENDSEIDNTLLESFSYQRKKEHGFFNDGEALFTSLFALREVFASPCLYIVKRQVYIENNLRFPIEIKYEDEVLTSKLFFYLKNCRHEKKVAFSRRIRANSTMTSKKTDKSFEDIVKVFSLLSEFYDSHKFRNTDAKGYFYIKLRNTYISCLSLYERSSKKLVKTSYNDLILLANKYRKFGFYGTLATFNFKMYDLLRNMILFIRKKLN